MSVDTHEVDETAIHGIVNTAKLYTAPGTPAEMGAVGSGLSLWGIPEQELETTITSSATANALFYGMFVVTKAIRITAVRLVTTSAGTTATNRWAIVEADPATLQPKAAGLIAQGTLAGGVGQKSTTGLTIDLQPGVYFNCYVQDGTGTNRIWLGVRDTGIIKDSQGSECINSFQKAGVGTGALSNPVPSWDTLSESTVGGNTHIIHYKWGAIP